MDVADPTGPAGAHNPVETLQVRLVQQASSLDPRENRRSVEQVARDAEAATPVPDLVVLPEAYARDFGKPGSPLGEHAETLDGDFAATLARLSRSGTSYLGGMFERGEDPDRPLNTLALATDGEVTPYRKIHLYDSFGYEESATVSPGALEPVVTEVGGFALGLMTCYDLRFPELARELALRGAEALVVPAAWVAGERKVDHWRTLLRARAIENTVWVVGVGQPGPRYTGHSTVIAPSGDVVVEAGEEAAVLDAQLDRTVVAEVRRTNPSLANRRL